LPLSVSDWPIIIMIHPGGFLSVVPPTIYCPSFSFMGGVAKEYIAKRGCENIFAGSHAEHRMFLCVIPLITFTEHLRLILNINEKKGCHEIGQLVHCSILSLLFSSVLFASFALRLLLLLCYCTLVPRTAASTLHNRISCHVRLIFT